jgi:hypothetical protein
MSWGSSLQRTANRFRDRSAADIDAAAASLVADARAAATLREYQQDPSVAALSIERSRERLDRWGWLFIVLGLLFTTVNVAVFVLGPVPEKGYAWYEIAVAVVVEPMVAGLLLVLLRGEQIAGRHGLKTGRWARNTRWTALAFTYLANTWTYWAVGDVRGIFIHSVPVVLVFLAAEALAQQREVLTRVVVLVASQAPTPVPAIEPVTEPVTQPLTTFHVVPPVSPDDEAHTPDPPQSPPPPSPKPPPVTPLPRPDGARRPGRPRSENRLRLEAAYARARASGLPHVGISPSWLDREAEVPVGTAKKCIDQIREEYEEQRTEVDTDVRITVPV